MQKLRTDSFLLILILLLAGSLPLAAQEASPQGTSQGTAEDAPPLRDTPISLTLNKVVGLPDQEVNVPILFARKSGAPNLAQLRMLVSYPGSVIQFDRVEDAYLARRVSLQIEGKETPAEGDQRSLTLAFTLPDPQSQEFPSGQIGSIYFKVAAGAPDQIVHLNPQAWIDGDEILPDAPGAQIIPGEVRVSQTPVFVSCFFFSH